MPRPEQVPSPGYERGANNLPYGGASAANSALPDPTTTEPSSFGDLFIDDDDFGDEEDNFAPQGDEETYLFSPTERPAEPISAGAPFGPGADFVRQAYESDRDFMLRVGQSLSGDPNPDVRDFVTRISEGL